MEQLIIILDILLYIIISILFVLLFYLGTKKEN